MAPVDLTNENEPQDVRNQLMKQDREIMKPPSQGRNKRIAIARSKPKISMIKEGETSGTKETDQVPVDIDKLVKSTNNKLKSLQPLSDTCGIYRVPAQLRELNEMAYTPRAVSVGPFHHGKEELKAMEVHKIRYFQDFLIRISGVKGNEDNKEELVNKSMEKLFECTRNLEKRLRDSYAEPIDIDKEEFLKMMLVDAAFVLEYFLKRHFKDWEESDRVFNKQRITNIVRFDILLIENQIPYFFLKELFNYLLIPDKEKTSMYDLVRRFLEESIRWDWLVENDNNVLHLVHFLKIGLQLSRPNPTSSEVAGRYEGQAAPTVSELHRAGVKFKATSDKSLLDIKFNKGILEIPKWKINDNTEILFRNIQAFEQCHYSDTTLSDYIAIMDFLINTPEDVELLVRNGIIENWLMDNQVAATLVNKLGTHNLTRQDDGFYFSQLILKLHQYYKNPWHNWKATLKQKYFDNPWTVISVIAAAVLLLLTIIQTVCSILQVV